MDNIPPDIQPDLLLDGASYAQRLEYFYKKSKKSGTLSDTLLLTGHGCRLKVSYNILSVYQGSTRGTVEEPILLYPGLHTIKQIVFLSTSGFITLDALRWCRDQGISILTIDELGNMIYSLSPESKFAAKLRRLQYHACDTDLGVSIVRELIKQKIETQITVLKSLPSHTVLEGRLLIVNGMRTFIKGNGQSDSGNFIWDPFESGMTEIDQMKDIESIRMLEGRLASAYWSTFVGLPIGWHTKDVRVVPYYWRHVTERWSPLSYKGTGHRAINPFHAALNYLYAVTEHQILVALYIEGLDPACGFLHTDSDDRMSLVYDLVEPLRAMVDAKVLAFFRHETFRRGDFTIGSDGLVLFNPELLRFLVASCKLDDSIPGGIVSWLKGLLEAVSSS